MVIRKKLKNLSPARDVDVNDNAKYVRLSVTLQYTNNKIRNKTKSMDIYM